MNLTKVILRKPSPEPGQALETIHYVPAGEPTPLDHLGDEYRSFKQANPERWARLPPTLKLHARSLIEAGASVDAVAVACGIHPGTVMAWLKRGRQARGARPEAKTKQSNFFDEVGSGSAAAAPSATAKGDSTVSSERLEALASAYKNFKKDHPERWARLPEGIKGEALKLLEAGASAEAIASACGIHTGSVVAWARPRTQPVGRPKGRRKNMPGQAPIVLAPTDRPSWVRVRVRGAEVEVNEADFLRLFT